MKVKELIELLQKEDPEREVVMSKDAEGNCFSPFVEFSTGTYTPDNTWSGEFRSDEDKDEKALCLWPVN